MSKNRVLVVLVLASLFALRRSWADPSSCLCAIGAAGDGQVHTETLQLYAPGGDCSKIQPFTASNGLRVMCCINPGQKGSPGASSSPVPVCTAPPSK